VELIDKFIAASVLIEVLDHIGTLSQSRQELLQRCLGLQEFIDVLLGGILLFFRKIDDSLVGSTEQLL